MFCRPTKFAVLYCIATVESAVMDDTKPVVVGDTAESELLQSISSNKAAKNVTNIHEGMSIYCTSYSLKLFFFLFILFNTIA